MVELSIIIVNWNGGELLRRCLESIAEAPPHVPYNVIVVDNASTDGSVAWLRSVDVKPLFKEAELIVVENSENLGFSKPNNQAIAISRAPLLFLLNPDAEVKPAAIDVLIATLKSDERNGAVGPRLLNTDGTLQPSVWHNPPAAWETLISGLKLYRLIPRRLRGGLLLGVHWDHAQRRSVPRLSGAAMLIKREVIESVGGLDEQFHMYGEDVEWCLRIRRAGWRLLFEPRAVVIHHDGHSSLKRWGNIERARRVLDGQLRFQKHHLSRPRLISNILAGLAVTGLAHLRRTLGGSSTAETKMALGVYGEYLKRALGEK